MVHGAIPETEVLAPGQGWDGWVTRARHDFYHLSAYHAFAEKQGEGRAWLAVHGTPELFIAWPYLQRDLGGGLSDGGSVYGYSGPVGPGLEDAAFRADAWSAFREVWAGQRMVSLFTRMHPLLGNAVACYNFHGAATPLGGELFHLGRSVSIDLSLSQDERRMSYPQPLRQDVKRAERQGMSVVLDRGWRHMDDFAAFYRATMEKNAANDSYLFPDSYFHDLRAALGGDLHLSVALVGDRPAAALMFAVCGELASAHLTGINPEFARLSPLKCLLDRTCDIAHEMGATRLHLGAGRGGREDQLFEFKSRFSADRHDFHTGRWILDAEAFSSLARRRKGAAVHDPVFFPSYRARAEEIREAG